VQELTERLEALEASHAAQVHMLTEELQQFKLNEVCAVEPSFLSPPPSPLVQRTLASSHVRITNEDSESDSSDPLALGCHVVEGVYHSSSTRTVSDPFLFHLLILSPSGAVF
jgi:hypothetical protein